MNDNDRNLGSEHSNRIWTVPNILSFIRLLGIPLFLWLVLVEQADVWAFVVLVLASASDWLDGALARALNQTSELGALLDPLADRLYIAATIIGLALRGIIPWWLVLALALRDVMLLLLLPALRRRGLLALPVTLLGKAATFCLLWGFPALLLGSLGGTIGTFALICGWAFSLWGTALYWWAGLDYVRRGLRLPLVT
ncbi:MAG: CDP-diacylglycerol--glycerol-3-phosphate 3-phosphatidyltransferase [Actinobacteria bacterium]|nr:MAG: CDP-diacylglycerol--glycerol-3-phosphate 3-phosphatidyltransferase [Actinomycetota bacterium]